MEPTLPVTCVSSSIARVSSCVVARRVPGGWRGYCGWCSSGVRWGVPSTAAQSVLRLDGTVEVGAHQDREDVGLQEYDQQFEEGHHDRHQGRYRAEDDGEVVAAQQVDRAEGEDHQQHVAGEHVGD